MAEHPYSKPKEERFLLENGKPTWEAIERERFKVTPHRYHIFRSRPGDYQIGTRIDLEDADDKAKSDDRKNNTYGIRLVKTGQKSDGHSAYEMLLEARPP